MTWSRSIILGWILLTFSTIGLQVRALKGVTYLSLGPVGVQLDHSILIEGVGGLWSFEYAFYPRDEIHDPSSSLFSLDVAGIWSEVSFPPWFPCLILTALLWPLFSRAKKREKNSAQMLIRSRGRNCRAAARLSRPRDQFPLLHLARRGRRHASYSAYARFTSSAITRKPSRTTSSDIVNEMRRHSWRCSHSSSSSP